MKNEEMLIVLQRIASGIAATFGSSCEVLIHDFKRPENAIVAIYNGQVTGRKVGDPLTDLALKELLKSGDQGDQINYALKTEDGRILKSTNLRFKGRDYDYVLCINFDCTILDMAQTIIGDILKTSTRQDDKLYKHSWEQIYDEIFENAIGLAGKPIPLMNKEDRLGVVRYLFENGAFVFQKGLVICAERLGVSRFTIYNDLKELGLKVGGK